MASALLRLQENLITLSPTEKNVAAQILERPQMVPKMCIHDLAKATFSSSSTIVRLCSHVGYSGYRDFRRAVTEELAVKAQSRGNEQKAIARTDSLDEIIEKVTYRNIAALEDTRALMDPEVLRRCAGLILGARTVYLFGIGASFCTAKDAYLKFLRMNKLCVLNEDWHSQLLQARNAGAEDLAIVISYSGKTEEIITCMKALKENHVPTIAITRLANTPVAQLADEMLFTAARETLFRSGAMSSRISQLNIIDILYTYLGNLEYSRTLDQLSRTHIHKPGEDGNSFAG